MLQRTLPAGFIVPCLPTKTDTLPSGGLWIHEIKHDGFRVIARKDGSGVQFKLEATPARTRAAKPPFGSRLTLSDRFVRRRSSARITSGRDGSCSHKLSWVAAVWLRRWTRVVAYSAAVVSSSSETSPHRRRAYKRAGLHLTGQHAFCFTPQSRWLERPRPHRRCWPSRSDLGERWPTRLVATAEEDRLTRFHASRPTQRMF
jgi:hypothetical protein